MHTIRSSVMSMLACLALAAGCGDIGTIDILWPGGPDCSPCSFEQAHVVVTPSQVQMESGDSIRLTAVAYDADYTLDPQARFAWLSGDTAVGVVNDAGWLFARAPGTVMVLARAQGFLDGGTSASVELGDADLGLDLTFTAIEAGSDHTCALTADGAAWCWGSGLSGQLGIGRINAERWTPTRVESELRWRSVMLGGSYACAVDESSMAWCWGSNWAGQLGTGNFDNRAEPAPVAGGEAFAQLDAGVVTACALRDTGRVRCWGVDYGRYGSGDAPQGLPHPVDAAGTHVFTTLGVGIEHACALDADGRAFCWGLNTGRLGSTSTVTFAVPTPVASTTTFAHLAVGSGLTCALDADGAAHCWGTIADQEWPVPTRVATAERFVSIVAGGMHACGLTADGRAFCWGLNFERQLGNGDAIPSTTPVPVAGSHRFASLTAGGQHTCGLTTGGIAYCWGSNVNGQLGIGNRRNIAVPQRVAGQ